MATTLGQKTRLCLMVTADAGAAVAERLQAALVAADIASVILQPGPSDALDAATARPFIGLVQKAGVAALIADDARLARTLKADGVHLSAREQAEDAYTEAREIVGAGLIVGMDAGRSRHDAMMLGEAGADYVGFGVARDAGATNPIREQRLDLIEWWAEIFVPPCIALQVATPEEAAALAGVGADFVALALPDAISLADARDLVAAFAQAIAPSEQVG